MERKIISTLDCPNLTNTRRDGNTTRQANFAIDSLFKGYDVKFHDHSNKGIRSDRHLFKKTIERLIREHDIQLFKLSVENLTIKLETKLITP